MPRSTNNPVRGVKSPKDKVKLAFSFDRVKAVSEATREKMLRPKANVPRTAAMPSWRYCL
jgi:hypothetical protein